MTIKQRYLSEDVDQSLAHVVEECGEFLQAAGKTQRWGWDSTNPEIPAEERETNLQWLRRELTDLEEAIAFLKAHMKNTFGG